MPYADPQKAKACRERWRKRNPEAVRAISRRAMRRWREFKSEDYREKYNTYTKIRRDTLPGIRVLHNLRGRIWKAVRGVRKSAQTQELLGCTITELRAYLEAQFRPGMTWENYGPVWHVDHIKPCAKFDLTDPAQQRICFNWSNLQPLFAEENLKKGAK